MSTKIAFRGVLSVAAALICATTPAIAAFAAAEVPGAKYAGTIGPGYPIHFRVAPNGRTIIDISVHFDATCLPGAGDEAPRYPFANMAIKDGKFSGDSSITTIPGAHFTLRLEGSFVGRAATGKAVSHASVKGLGSCSQTEPFIMSLK